MDAEQRAITFTGQVQGVGFRYTTCRIASRFDVTGYVKNLPDGRFECVVEGRPAEIDAFLDEIGAAYEGYIRERDDRTDAPSGRFAGFDVRY